MTVSHLFFNRHQVDASLNYQAHERNWAKEKPNEKIKAEYNVNDLGFRELINGIVCGTYTIFTYEPTENECK